MPTGSWRCVASRLGIVRGELLILVRDGGHLDCLEGLRLAECVSDIPSLHDSLRQEANPEPTWRSAPDSEPGSGTRPPALGLRSRSTRLGLPGTGVARPHPGGSAGHRWRQPGLGWFRRRRRGTSSWATASSGCSRLRRRRAGWRRSTARRGSVALSQAIHGRLPDAKHAGDLRHRHRCVRKQSGQFPLLLVAELAPSWNDALRLVGLKPHDGR